MTSKRTPSSKRTLLVALTAFVLAFIGSHVLHRGSALHDTDSYYHLAIARLFAEEGIVTDLPQLRMSLLGDGFGDKEFLFHLLLAPLAGSLDPLVAGRLALALLAASIAALIAAMASRVLGFWGVLVPFWLFFASTEFAWRLVRLRPELLSLPLLLAAALAIGLGKYRALGLIAFLYTWSYTAFQAFLGLIVLCFAYFTWTRRRLHGALLLYPLLGVGLALVLHPHFPKNLEIWIIQNVEFFLKKSELAVGTEIRANFTDVVLLVHLGWLLGMVALTLAFVPDPDRQGLDENDGTDRLAETLGIFTLAFGGLYILMARFSIYFFPLATLWWLHELHRRGLAPSAWCRLPVRGRLPLALAALVCLAVSFPEARRQLGFYHHRTQLGPGEARLRDRQALSEALPEGAHVAADWGPTATLMLWAPQARYLNVLDPVFMATPYPEAHQHLEAIYQGLEPDVPLAAHTWLDSDHLVYRTLGLLRLEERLQKDPRAMTLHRGTNTLVRFRPAAQAGFVLDWRLVPDDVKTPFRVDPHAVSTWSSYPRWPDPRVRPLEAYVDAERVNPKATCLRFMRQFTLDQATALDVEISPYGPTSVWVDGRLRLGLQDEMKAILGQGAALRLPLTAGRHRVLVLTCEGTRPNYKGFYWRE